MAERPLTHQQEAFCRCFATPDAEGRPPKAYAAYFEAYPNCKSQKQAEKKASILLDDERVKARVGAIREQIVQDWVQEKLPYTNLVARIAAGLDSMSTKTASFQGSITDHEDYIDWGTRATYIGLALKVGNYLPAEKKEISGPGGVPLNLAPHDPAPQLTTEQLNAIFAAYDNHPDKGTGSE